MKDRLKNVVFSLIILLAIWQAMVIIFPLPKFIVATPYSVFLRMMSGYSIILALHSLLTVAEILLGLLMAIVVGVCLSFAVFYTIFYTPRIGKVLKNLIITLKSLPKMVFAPLLLLWLGHGIFPKCIIVALICFFPIVVNFTNGLADVDKNFIDLCRTYKMKESEILRKVRLRNALPDFFVGIKTALVFSVMGALVAEFYFPEEGLGYLVWLGSSDFKPDIAYSGASILSAISISFYQLVLHIEEKIVFWKESKEFI